MALLWKRLTKHHRARARVEGINGRLLQQVLDLCWVSLSLSYPDGVWVPTMAPAFPVHLLCILFIPNASTFAVLANNLTWLSGPESVFLCHCIYMLNVELLYNASYFPPHRKPAHLTSSPNFPLTSAGQILTSLAALISSWSSHSGLCNHQIWIIHVMALNILSQTFGNKNVYFFIKHNNQKLQGFQVSGFCWRIF